MAAVTLQNRWAVLALLFFARASMAVQFQAVAPIAPLLVAKLGLSYTQIGTLIGVSTFSGVFLSIPSGLLGRRFGDKPVVLAALALLAGGAMLFAH